MKKIAQIQTYWPKIYQLLKSPPAGVNLGSFPSQLPPMNKIQIDQGQHPDEPQAFGYVTTEDTNADGNLDTIHISSPRLSQELQGAGIDAQMLGQLDSLTPEQMLPILQAFVELISHEMGHLQDFAPDQDNPFPGGEAAAETAARSAVQQLSVATTNISTRFDKLGSFQMSMEVLEELNKLAAELDDLGFTNFSDTAEKIMGKYAQTFEDELDAGLQAERVDKERVRKSINLPGYVRLADPAEKGFYPFYALESHPYMGKIQPAGDPYSYDYLEEEGVFVVRTGKGEERHKAVGYKIKPGTAAYEKLAPYLPKPAAPAAPAAVARPKDDVLIKSKELGLVSPPGSADEVDGMYETQMSMFQSGLDSAAGYIERSAGMVKPSGWGVMDSILDTLRDHNATYEQKLEAWKSFKSASPTLLSEDAARKADRMLTESFDQYLRGESLLELKSMMGSSAEDMETVASNEQEVKTAALKSPKKEDFAELFWSGRSTGPFGRDRS